MWPPVSSSLYMADNIKALFKGRLLSVKAPPGSSPKGVALCLRFLNEAPYLDEWINYYLAAGIDHFYLYNNMSDDNFAEVLAPHIAAGYITLIEWPNKPASPAADEDFIRRTIGRFEWVGVFDADEFIIIRDGRKIPEFLKGFPNAPAVALHWYYFGSNGHRKRPSNSVIEAYTRRQPTPNRHVKCFVRPETVTQNRNAHCWFYRGARWAVNEHGKPILGTIGKPTAEHAWINHYYCKSLEDFLEKALRKFTVNGTPMKYRSRVTERAEAAIAESNDVEDRSAIVYLQMISKAKSPMPVE
jgi:hypothetical protein